MGEEKFASLSSGLLARKGAAKPAMRRQGFINPDGDVTEDLGWNDMGLETPHPVNGDGDFHGEAPLPEVRKQQEQLAEGLNGADHAPLDLTDTQLSTVLEEEPEQQDSEPYKTNGHGGLSPMAPSVSEIEPVSEPEPVFESEPVFETEAVSEPETVEDPYEQIEAEQVSLPVAEADEGVRNHGQSPLSVKKADRAEPVEQAPLTERKEPKEENVPARQKVAFTLRLNKERHLKLRLASAVTNQSAQCLVTEALDQFLEQHPDVQALTGPMSAANKH